MLTYYTVIVYVHRGAVMSEPKYVYDRAAMTLFERHALAFPSHSRIPRIPARNRTSTAFIGMIYLSSAASRRETPKFNCADNCGDGGVTWPPETIRCTLRARSAQHPPPRPRHPAARDLRDATGITFAQLPIRRQYAHPHAAAMAFGNGLWQCRTGHCAWAWASLSHTQRMKMNNQLARLCQEERRSHLAVHSPSSAALNGSSSSSDSKSSSSSSHAFASTSVGGSTCQIKEGDEREKKGRGRWG